MITIDRCIDAYGAYVVDLTERPFYLENDEDLVLFKVEGVECEVELAELLDFLGEPS